MQEKMKKAIMPEFFVWTILAIFAFGISVTFASKFFKFSDEELNSYNKLNDEISFINNGEIYSLPYHFDKESLVVGFSKNSRRFEVHEYTYSEIQNKKFDRLISFFEKPSECNNDKACMCMCKEYSAKANLAPYHGTCEKILCKNLENVDILSETIVQRYPNGKVKYVWSGGFLFGRDLSGFVNGFVNEISNPSLYIERYNNFVSVCTSDLKPCISDENKKVIDAYNE